MPEVTVVIPTHDRDDLLAVALASVLAQELRPSEVVVSDDRGAPSTRSVVADAARRTSVPVRYVDSSGPGAGAAGASRNAGAAFVETDVVAFLDDDDTWSPAFLARTVEALVDAHADFAVGWTRASEQGYEIARMRPGLVARDVVGKNPGFLGSNFVMTTAAFRSIGGFDPALTVANDKDLLVRALAAGLRYAVVEEFLVTNRIHGSGQLTDKTERRVAGIRTYMTKHAALLSARDRRYLHAQIASVRRVTAPTAISRFSHGVVLAGDRTLYRLLAGRG